MRTLIKELDLNNIVGNFIVELDDNDEHIDFTKSNIDDFWIEKRIRYVSFCDKGIHLGGTYYSHEVSNEDFIHKFNGKKGRFNRVLNMKELTWLMGKMVERNS